MRAGGSEQPQKLLGRAADGRVAKTPESSTGLFPLLLLGTHFSIVTPGKSPSPQSLCPGLQPPLPTGGACLCPLSNPGVPVHCPAPPIPAGQQAGASMRPMARSADVFARPFQSLQEVVGRSRPPSCLLLPGPPLATTPGWSCWGRPRVLVSGTGSGPPVPGLPGTGPSPAPSQSPWHCSPLLPLLALCSWCRRCAGRAKRLGSGSSPAPAARWPHTAAQDRGEVGVRSRWGRGLDIPFPLTPSP